ncbi:methyltransferase, FxLD system [Streptomyces sp. NPDC056144]|uniref:methyltransferase, FxLD system n=1 Tax=unclassified Streptomyces TaxID=2593676 RepID=UPI0035E21E6B
MTDTPTLAERRNRLVDQIASGRTLPEAVERAMRTVERDRYLPGLDPYRAYTDEAVSIKENPDGPLPLSLASVPSIVAMMLAQLDPQLGDNILEIGAGTGYNAALLAEVVGPDGAVTTVDIDSDAALHARQTLNATGFERVTVIERDGLKGAPENAPYDRMTATVGLWDIPRAWWEQLDDGGRLVLPFRWRGQTQSVALVRRGNTLLSEGMELCGFVPVLGQDGERTVELLDGRVRLHHDQDQVVDAEALAGVFDTPKVEVWSGARVGGEEPFDGIWLRATVGDDVVCRVAVTSEALEAGVRRPVIPIRTPALVVDGSLAYTIVMRQDADSDRSHRMGAVGYGPDGAALAARLVKHIDAWGADRKAVPTMTIYPVDSLVDKPEKGHLIMKSESVVVLAYS